MAGGDRPEGLHRQPGDGWLDCPCGRRHWGLHGAAGLLLVGAPEHTGTLGTAVVLQHRALWSDAGGTWGIPGGALAPGETPVEGALRESAEEAGIQPEGLEVVGTTVLDHGAWSYTTVLARTTAPQTPTATDHESLAIAWILIEDVERRLLHPGFGRAWPDLRRLVEGVTGRLG